MGDRFVFQDATEVLTEKDATFEFKVLFVSKPRRVRVMIKDRTNVELLKLLFDYIGDDVKFLSIEVDKFRSLNLNDKVLTVIRRVPNLKWLKIKNLSSHDFDDDDWFEMQKLKYFYMEENAQILPIHVPNLKFFRMDDQEMEDLDEEAVLSFFESMKQVEEASISAQFMDLGIAPETFRHLKKLHAFCPTRCVKLFERTFSHAVELDSLNVSLNYNKDILAMFPKLKNVSFAGRLYPTPRARPFSSVYLKCMAYTPNNVHSVFAAVTIEKVQAVLTNHFKAERVFIHCYDFLAPKLVEKAFAIARNRPMAIYYVEYGTDINFIEYFESQKVDRAIVFTFQNENFLRGYNYDRKKKIVKIHHVMYAEKQSCN